MLPCVFSRFLFSATDISIVFTFAPSGVVGIFNWIPLVVVGGLSSSFWVVSLWFLYCCCFIRISALSDALLSFQLMICTVLLSFFSFIVCFSVSYFLVPVVLYVYSR